MSYKDAAWWQREYETMLKERDEARQLACRFFAKLRLNPENQSALARLAEAMKWLREGTE